MSTRGWKAPTTRQFTSWCLFEELVRGQPVIWQTIQHVVANLQVFELLGQLVRVAPRLELDFCRTVDVWEDACG